MKQLHDGNQGVLSWHRHYVPERSGQVCNVFPYAASTLNQDGLESSESFSLETPLFTYLFFAVKLCVSSYLLPITPVTEVD